MHRSRKEVDELRVQVEARDRALQEISRTGDRAVQDKSKIEQEARQRDVRLNRALEDVEKYVLSVHVCMHHVHASDMHIYICCSYTCT